MRLSKPYIFRMTIASVLTIFGLIQWSWLEPQGQATFDIQSVVYESSNSVNEIGSSPQLCKALLEDDGYLLIYGSASVEQLDIQQGLFQTSDDESGIFLEIDANELNLLRIGIGDEELQSAELFPIRRLNRHQQFSFVVLITADDQVRIASDGIDTTSTFTSRTPGCENFLVGSGNGNLPFVGSIRLGVTFGSDLSEVSKLIDRYSEESLKLAPSHSYRIFLYSGLLFLLILIVPLRKKRYL